VTSFVTVIICSNYQDQWCIRNKSIWKASPWQWCQWVPLKYICTKQHDFL